ncbi:hypothetical protein LSAT2_013711 [Lamellibrachia satsuma]|nr:hypothetical protein LSAT2_013711 [Lamellibrachia satsuma]
MRCSLCIPVREILLLVICAVAAASGDHFIDELSSANDTEGVADSYLVYTGYTDGYSNVFIPGNEYFRFQVLACHDVTVALSAVPGVTDRQTYEVLIGGAQNNLSEIRTHDSGQPAAQNTTPGLLDCDEYRPFWIMWEDGDIVVGRGRVLGEQIFVQLKNPQNSHEVRGVSVKTGKDTPGKWFIPRDLFAYLHTPDVHRNKYMWIPVSLGQHSSIIRVKACSDVHVALAPIFDNATDYVDITIGGWNNKQTAIRVQQGDHETIQVAEDTRGIVNCDEWRQFWIRWEYNVVEAGAGNDVGASRVIHWSSVDPIIVTALSVSTGDGFKGEWGFTAFSSKSVFVLSRHDDASPLVHIRPDRGSFVFRIVACSDAQLNLLRRPGDLQSVSYRVIIGANGNNRTGIYRVADEGRNETLLKEAFTPDILDCDHPRDFWVLYTYGLVLFGKGQKVFHNTLLDVFDVEMEPVHELALSAGGAKWIFNRDYALSVSMMTTGNFGIGRLWLSVTYVHDVVFKVRACANVHVALTKYLGMADYDSYEVVIGTNFNGVTQILNSTDGTVIETTGSLKSRKSVQ